MTREEFSKEMKTYEKEIEGKSFSFKKILNIFKEYIVFILAPFAVISFIYIFKINKFKKEENED